MAAHESDKERCRGSHECQMCGLQVSKEEVQSNSHNCFNSLAQHLQRMVEEKDKVIEILRDELKRKNKQILEFIEKQTILESRL